MRRRPGARHRAWVSGLAEDLGFAVAVAVVGALIAGAASLLF